MLRDALDQHDERIIRYRYKFSVVGGAFSPLVE